MGREKEELHEAILWQKERNGVRCLVCSRECFINKDKRGFCQVRENRNNKLYTLNFGKVVGREIRPIEKNPLFHFYPGTNSLCVGVFGCNLFSQFCSRFEIDNKLHEKTIENAKYEYHTPDEIVEMAEKKNCTSITYNLTEPTVGLEFVFRTAKLAERSNIKNVIVTNGFISQEAVKKIAKHINAATVNIIASADPEFYKKFASVEHVTPIFAALRQMKKHRIFVEITNTIVPQIGDNLDMGNELAERISNDLSPETPYHILQFHPYAFSELPPTPISVLERFSSEAKKVGLRYVYIGNTNLLDESTYCHNCNEILIQRKGSVVKKINLIQDRCPKCGFKTNVIRD